jgi:hypothetical protein
LKIIEDAVEKRASIEPLCEAAKLEVAQKRCLDFAAKLYTIFPTELRHMVYEYIWNDRALSKSTAKSLLVLPSLRESVDCTRNTRSWTFVDSGDLPICVRREFVGLDVAKETVATYYRTVGLPRTVYYYEIKFQLLRDHFHIGVLPVDHIRRIEHEIDDVVKDIFENRDEARQLYIVDCYRQLDKIRQKNGFILSLRSEWGVIVAPYYSVLNHLRPIFMNFRDSGAIVSLVVTHEYTGKDYDISDIIGMEINEWEEKWRNILRDDLLPFAKRKLRHSSNDPVAWSVVERYGGFPKRSLDRKTV